MEALLKVCVSLLSLGSSVSVFAALLINQNIHLADSVNDGSGLIGKNQKNLSDSNYHYLPYDFFSLNLGNVFSPFVSLQLKNQEEPVFVWDYLFTSKKFYFMPPLSRWPVTILSYTNGQPGEQTFRVYHQRHFSTHDFYKFQFLRAGAKGAYQHQATDVISFLFLLQMDSVIRKNSLRIETAMDRNEIQENGGLLYEQDFYDATDLPSSLQAVIYDMTTGLYNRWRNTRFYIQDYFTFLPRWKLLVSHTYHLQQKKASALFLDTSYIPAFRISLPGNWQDIVFYNSNMISAGLQYGSDSGLRVSCQHHYQYFDFNTNDLFSDYSNQSLYALLHYNKRTLAVTAGVDYFYKGFRKDDQCYEIGIEKKYASIRIRAGFTYRQEHYSPFYYHFRSGMVRWAMTPLPKRNSSVTLKLTSAKHMAEWCVDYLRMENYMYFDVSSLPHQWNSAMQAITMLGSKSFYLWGKTLEINLKGGYQYVDSKSILRVPSWLFSGEWACNVFLFKKSLKIRIGTSTYWFSQFPSYGYNPFIAQFYFSPDFMAGNYWWVDPFCSLYLKHFNAFVKISNAGSFIFDKKYMFIERYPQYNAMVKVGLNWTFLN